LTVDRTDYYFVFSKVKGPMTNLARLEKMNTVLRRSSSDKGQVDSGFHPEFELFSEGRPGASERAEAFDCISRLLTRAFFNDPFYAYIMPEEKRRTKQLLWWMKALTEYTYRFGCIQALPEYRGAAFWLGPDHTMFSTAKLMRLGLYKVPWKLGIPCMLRTFEVTGMWEKWHRHAPRPHLYLAVIGIDPSCQRKGWGSRLMAPALQIADERRWFCHLETATEGDIAFYGRHGFEVTQSGRMNNGTPHWAMDRKPKV
jgi:ribosomal protein S18 acetylase RimI-like enzyme